LRDEDTAARLGGDEFALLIGGLKASGQCEQVLKRILDTVAAPYLIGTEEVHVSASIGVTICPGDAGGAEQLLRHADQSMYKAKQTGKNRFCLFDPTLESQARANFGLLRKIEQALERHEFCLYYQPIVDCWKGRVVAIEALIRWQHPVLGLRAPGEFLPLIEHEDIIITLGEWVIAEALRELERLQQAGFDLTLCVNVSARQVLRGNFQQRLGELLAAHDPALAHRLEIEILETAALEDINLVVGLISYFHQKGVHFSLDDFGTGYSSLIHLRRLAADVLKIDQTFVRDMLVDPGDLAIVHGVLGLAMAFQRQVVAEGAESIEHILMLLELGCDVMQGFGIARPLPADRLLEWLEEFQPDPRWRVPHSAYPSHSDFEMLLMEVSHRHWLEALLGGLHNPSAASDPPALDCGDCRLGQWLTSPAVIRRFADKTGFRRIDAIHRAVHRAAQALLACADPAQRLALQAALEAEQVALLQQLHDFRTSEACLTHAAQSFNE
jgi:predicted signal transduction protein with EAL and GGDEF domain